MPRGQRNKIETAPAELRSAQLALDFSVQVSRPRAPRTTRHVAPPDSAARYFTRLEAAAYIRCSPRFLDGLELPFIRKGRCKVYDRVDLDAHMQDDGQRGRAWKEILWPVIVDSTAALTRGTGGSTSFSRTDDAYARALGVSNAPMPKRSPSA
jgi:hypothetical protein